MARTKEMRESAKCAERLARLRMTRLHTDNALVASRDVAIKDSLAAAIGHLDDLIFEATRMRDVALTAEGCGGNVVPLRPAS